MQTARRQYGFTLLEILVVVFIVAVVASTAVVSIGILRDDRDLEREADRAVALLKLALDDAVLQGRDFGMEFLRTGYRFVEYDPDGGRWADVPLDPLLGAHTLPEGLELELYIDDRSVRLADTPMRFDPVDDEDRRAQNGEEYSPHAYLFSSGDVSAFELHIVRFDDNARVAFSVDLLGEVVFLGDEAVL